MTDVFISYASEDREQARKLASVLETHGWSVWWDRKIKAGQTFDQIIEHELEIAKSVVVLWSKDSVSSEWVKNEAATGAERGVLVPALIDSVKLPLEFRRRQTADLIGWEGDTSHAGFQALCDGIAAKAGMTPAPLPDDSKAPRKARFHWNQRWVVTSIAAIVAVLAGAVYIGVRYLPQQTEGGQGGPVTVPIKSGTGMEESKASSSSSSKTRETGDGRTFSSTEPTSPASQPEPQATPRDSSEGGFKAGTFEFKWPGGDCWAIYRGEERISSSCGSGKQALQAGTYTVKPSGSGVFIPFSIVVKPGSVMTADAMGGIFEFKWPGGDCWAIYRGEERVSSSCGSGKQVLQAGTYTVKPSGSGVFEPFKIQVTKGETVTVP
jgi:hypothetical protein